jgi:hypothetical protein
MYLVYRREEGGSPEEVILRDRPLLADLARGWSCPRRS